MNLRALLARAAMAAFFAVSVSATAQPLTAPIDTARINAAYETGDVATLEALAAGSLAIPAELAETPGEAFAQRLSIAQRLRALDSAAALRAYAALAALVATAESTREGWIVDRRADIVELYQKLAELQTTAGDKAGAAASAGRAFQHAVILHSPDSDALDAVRHQLAEARAQAGLPPVNFEDQKKRMRAAPSKRPFNLVEVHYATHRKPTGKTAPGQFYGGDTGPMRYGKALVSVPTNREIGSLPKPSIWSLEFRTDPAKHIALTKVQPIADRASFLASVRSRIGKSRHKDIFVFVHGFNSSFEASVERAGQLAADLHMDGVPIVYSWPSQGSVAAYLTDAKTVANPQIPNDVASFLTDVARKTGATRVHLVAHSMGNRVMLAALQKLAASGGSPRFSEVVFAAPDVGQKDFLTALPRIQKLGNRFTLYASKRDKALLVSRGVNGEARAGDANNLIVRPGLQSIDTSLASGGLLGHNDFAGSALEDFRAVLWLSLAPEKRCVLQSSGSGARRHWIFNRTCDESEFREATARVWAAGSPTAAIKRLDQEITKSPARAGILRRLRNRVLSTFGGR